MWNVNVRVVHPPYVLPHVGDNRDIYPETQLIFPDTAPSQQETNSLRLVALEEHYSTRWERVEFAGVASSSLLLCESGYLKGVFDPVTPEESPAYLDDNLRVTGGRRTSVAFHTRGSSLGPDQT